METISKLKYADGTKSNIIHFDDFDGIIPEADLYVCDTNTKTFLGDFEAVVLPCGEENKGLPAIERILVRAIEKQLDRSSIIVAIGGGVVCDMTAFAASIYMRGCRIILIPTTLLSQVDAAIGGKTGIDYKGCKNLVGSFYPAEEVRICSKYIETLSDREFWSGFGEVIKTALLGDSEMWEIIKSQYSKIINRDPEILKDLIKRCALVKCKVVQEDLTEKGIRAILNLGHTFGHALEMITNFSMYTHGEAIVWGMKCAMIAGVQKNLTSKSIANEVLSVIDKFPYELPARIREKEFIDALLHDKKITKGVLKFVLLEDILKPIRVELSSEEILEATREVNNQ